jgi:hypothetical protein
MEEVGSFYLPGESLQFTQAVEMLLEWKSCGSEDPGLKAKFSAIERQASV